MPHNFLNHTTNKIQTKTNVNSIINLWSRNLSHIQFWDLIWLKLFLVIQLCQVLLKRLAEIESRADLPGMALVGKEVQLEILSPEEIKTDYLVPLNQSPTLSFSLTCICISSSQHLKLNHPSLSLSISISANGSTTILPAGQARNLEHTPNSSLSCTSPPTIPPSASPAHLFSKTELHLSISPVPSTSHTYPASFPSCKSQ